MPALFANVPDGIVWGRVTAYVTGFVADGGTELPDGTPDAVPLEGTITLTPTVGVMAFPSLAPPQQAVIQSLECPIIEGVLYAPGTTPDDAESRDPGVVLVASEQPLGLPDHVQYKVTWQLKGARVNPSPMTIDVPSQATVDLATVIPATPGPGVVVVVSTEERERAEAAAVAAELAAERAENASMGDIDYDLILGRVEPLVDSAVAEGLAGVDDRVAAALVPYATTSALTSGLAGKQPVGDYATTADLTAYATTAYVDQTVGDIDTALSGILGGE